MKFIFPLLSIAFFATLAVLLIAYVCFRIVFFVPRKNELASDDIPLPDGALYEPLANGF